MPSRGCRSSAVSRCVASGDRATPHREVQPKSAPAAACALVLATIATAAPLTREQVEVDWGRQDACRTAEIREPGLVRFVETDLHWPGVKADDRSRVPKAPTPKLDGRLDDVCWQQALKLSSESATAPAVLLAHDDRQLHVGLSLPTHTEAGYRGEPTAKDAGGAVDGVKNGRYAFHTGHEPNPWWQVDLGRRRLIARMIVYNRLDYAPGLHNADHLIVLTSDDEKHWTLVYDNQGKHFGGVTMGKPLVVNFGKEASGGKRAYPNARFVRLQVRSATPLFFHLDEVEIFGPDEPGKNIALHRPAKQSSLSIWSRGYRHSGGLLTLDNIRVALHPNQPDGVTLGGALARSDQACLVRRDGRTHIEIALPLEQFPGGFPAQLVPVQGPPIRLAAGANWQLTWSSTGQLGFGKNVLTLALQSQGPLAEPLDVTVESVVFTPFRAERQVALRTKLAKVGPTPVTIHIAHEGPAAVIVSARQGKAELREGKAFFVPPVAETLRRTERLLAGFGLPAPAELAGVRAKAEALATREKANGPDPPARQALYRQARWLAREVAFRDPQLRFEKLLLVKRFTQEAYPDVCLNHMPWVSRPGGDVCIVSLDLKNGRHEVRNVLNGALGSGHVHGMDLSWDAKRIVLGYAKAKTDKPPDGWLDRRTSFELRRNEEPTHLFEIGVDGKGLRQVTRGEWSDLDPTYLANGDIAFVSERCACSLQCNEYDKDETSCNLYVVHPDGSNIRHMSVSKDGDYLPHALADGTLGYTRWEYQERGWAHIQSIWTIRPNGTGADALFKQHLNNPWALEDVRSIPGSRSLIAIATGHHTLPAGPVVIVNPDSGLNDTKGIGIVTPGVSPPEGGMAGRPVAEGGVVGRGGFYMTPWPLSPTSVLVPYTFGKQTDTTGYAIYLIDVHGTKELIYRDPNISCFVPIPLRPRPRPPVFPELREPGKDTATCVVVKASHGVDGVPAEAIRYIRISKRDQWPYCNTYGGQRYEKDVKGVMINWTPARVIGTVPVEADGSAHFEVPADTPVYFQLLDEDHRELRRMRSFISFQPGEVRSCMGCHETRAEAPPACDVPMALRRGPRVPVPPPWGNRAISFLRDVQPVLDAHCVRCHAGLKPAGKLDLSGGLTANHNRAYDTLLANNLVARSNVGDDAKITAPLAFGSHKSKLIAVLQGKSHRNRVKLTRNDWLRLVTWIDANAPYHDGFINKRLPVAPYDLPADVGLTSKIAAVHAKRCAACHQPADVTRTDWIDLGRPERSRFLTAPLAKADSPAHRCPKPVYKDATDPDYRAVLQTISAAVAKAWDRPRRDLRAFNRP